MEKYEKVYSPDIDNYSFEGRSGIFGTISAVFVAPVRLIHRVTHNIVILPASMLGSYANGLLMTSITLFVIGIFDYLFYDKWPLFVSQVPVLVVALYLKKMSNRVSTDVEEKREIYIDNVAVEQLCDTVTERLDKIIGKEEI